MYSTGPRNWSIYNREHVSGSAHSKRQHNLKMNSDSQEAFSGMEPFPVDEDSTLVGESMYDTRLSDDDGLGFSPFQYRFPYEICANESFLNETMRPIFCDHNYSGAHIPLPVS